MCRKMFRLSLLMASLFFSLATLQNGYSQMTEDNYKLEQGLIYGMTETDPLTLNIATPNAGGLFPCIVYVGWSGVASYNTIAAINAAEKGYVGVVLDYRRNAKFPIPIGDLKCALSWLAANSATYQIDPTRIALAGFHFGGYIALLAAYTTETQLSNERCENKGRGYTIRAVIALGAPTDWSKVSDETYYGTLRGGDSKQEFFAKSSPLDYIDAKDPPTLIIHGDIDKDTSPINAELLDKKLTQKGVPHQYVLLIDQDVHIMEQWHSELSWEFLMRHLK